MLADSFKTRFRPFTKYTPRCLLPLANTPLIEYTLEFLANSGVEEVYVYCGANKEHLEQIEAYLQYACTSTRQNELGLIRTERQNGRNLLPRSPSQSSNQCHAQWAMQCVTWTDARSSPVTSHMSHDDYASAMRHQGPPQYGAIDGSAHYNHNSSAPPTPLSAGPHPSYRQQPGHSHRRQVSDMGGEDQSGPNKRHQMQPPQHQPHQMYQR